MCPLHRLLMTEQTDLNVQLAAVGEGRHPADKVSISQYQRLSDLLLLTPAAAPGLSHCRRAAPPPQTGASAGRRCARQETSRHTGARGGGRGRRDSPPRLHRSDVRHQDSPRYSIARYSPSSTKLLLPNTAAEMGGGCVSPRGRGGQASTSRGRVVTGSLITHTATTSPPVILPPPYRLFYLRGFP